MLKQTLVGVIAVTVLVVNPMLGCNDSSNSDDAFAFGESEMRAVVAGTYLGELPSTGELMTLKLDEASGTPGTTTQSTKRVQCNNRSFVQSAAACMSATEMHLSGSIASTGTTIASGALKSGSFVIWSRLLEGGELSLTLPDGAHLTAKQGEGSEFHDWKLMTVDGQILSIDFERSQ
jgi:hypothetical protein